MFEIRFTRTTASENALNLASQNPTYTLSEFHFLNLSHADLDDLINNRLPQFGIDNVNDLQDTHPYTATQEGILFSQQKDLRTYQVTCVLYSSIYNQSSHVILFLLV